MTANWPAQLGKLATVTASGAVTPGQHSSFNATSGALTATLPALTTGAVATALAAGQVVRAKISKSKSDTTANVITVACSGADTFEGGATTQALVVAGEKLTLVAQTVPGASGPTWVVEDHTTPRDTIDLRYGRRNVVPQGLIDSAGSKYFDGQLATYNLRPGNTKRYRTALGKAMAGTGLCHVVCAGESTTAGRSLTNSELAYPAFLRKAMASAGVPLAGNGAAFYTRGEAAVVDAFTTITGTWSQVAQQLYTQSTSAGATMTVQVVGTSIDIISSNYGAFSFTYTIDGGSAVTVTSASANSLRRTTITGLTDAAHTVILTVVSGTVIIYSVEGYRASGLRVTNAGSSGSRTNVWDATQFFSCAGAVIFQNPHLVLFGLTINDLNASITKAAFKAAMLATITGYLTNSDVMIVTSNAATGSWTQQQWDDYQSALYEIADQLDIPLIDVYSRFPSYTENNAAGLMIDTYHPNASYYAERGRHHARVLLGV